MRRGFAAACALFALAASTGARAEVRRLGVAPSGDALPAALSTALAPWQVEIVAVEVSPADLAQADELARVRSVDAVVWVSEATLWVYDAVDHKVLGTRVVSAPPFDEPTAAAVALSVKTLLRHSLVAPAPERFGAAIDRETPPAIAPAAAGYRRDPRLLLSAGAGARAYRDDALVVGSRFSLQLAWYPGGGALAVVAAIDAGPDRVLAGDEFVGSFRDNAVSLGGRVSAALPAARLVAHAQLAASLRQSSIEGVVISAEQAARDRRLNPALAAELGLRRRVVADLYLELAFGGDLALERQRYTVFGAPVLVVPRVGYAGRFAVVVPFL